ncbi:MAG: Asp-tRNA(Asn)/Glu-tRNA(Gln) amidotransferase subunit GatC [bacterium]|nr:Asp-tRNA(Asn)/Glu-tRNA(Gln) amidotransferase subunit GatC [bacterium]
MISKKDVEHMARLARIEVTEAEKEKLEKDLAGILDFINKLNKIDTAGIEPLAGGLVYGKDISLMEAARSDEIIAPLGDPAGLVNSSPWKEDGWIETKRVFKETK